MLEYHMWKNDQKSTNSKKENHYYDIDNKNLTQLHEIYDRKLVIFEDILMDLSPQLDDEQYCGTTSWGYEKELKELSIKQEELEKIIEVHHEKKEEDEKKAFLVLYPSDNIKKKKR